MSKRLLAAIVALSALVLGAGVAPAFTADSGTITVSVTAQAPPAELCIEFLDPPGTSVGFGTRAFSAPGAAQIAGGNVSPRFRNCATSNEQITIAGSDATSESATWELVTGYFGGCPSSPLNQYALKYILDIHTHPGGIAFTPIAKTPSTLLASAAPGEDHVLDLTLFMPCVGSDGAGETLSTSVVLTAVLP